MKTGAKPARAGWRAGLPLVGIGLALAAAYANSFQVPFVMDDIEAVRDNAQIRRLWSWEVFQPPLGTTVGWRPLLNLSFAVNYAVSGLELWSYHLANLLIHLAAALVLYALVAQALRGLGWGAGERSALPAGRHGGAGWLADPVRAVSFAAALLWALHPLQTESVTYIVQRAESLSSLFFLLTVYLAARGACAAEPAGGTSRRALGWYAASVAACLLGSLTKEILVTAPLVLLLFDRAFLAGSFRGALRKRGWLYLALAACFLALLPELRAGRDEAAGFGAGGGDPLHYLLTQAAVVVHYLRLVFWPHPLVFDYHWPLVASWRQALLPGTGVALLMALSGVALWRRPALGFAAAAFFLILAPTSSLLPILMEVAAEHRMYLPMAPLLAAAVVGAWELSRRRGSILHPRFFWVGVALCALLLGGLTWRRNRDYAGVMSLWNSVLVHYPDSPRALYNRALAWEGQGELERAMQDYRHVLRVAPDYRDAQINLGLALINAGRFDEAQQQLRQAQTRWPDSPEVRNNLGVLYGRQQRYDKAVVEYREAVRLNPSFSQARYNLATALLETGQSEGAVGELKTVVSRQPDMAPAHLTLANLLARQGQDEQALRHYREALRLRPAHAPSHFNLALLLLKRNERDQARLELQATLAADPGFEPARQALASLN